METNYDWVKQIKVIGWDLDGTLYTANSELEREIVSLRNQRVMEALGLGLEESIKKYNEVYLKLGSHTKTITSLGVDGESFFVEVWDQIKLEKYIKPDPKINELFKQLSKYRMFLLSNSNTLEQIKKKLGLVGLSVGVFEVIQDTVGLGAVKPDSKPFEVVMEKMAFGADEAMYVGDRVSTDVRGARGVGIKACLVGRESEEADVCLPTVYDVGKLFS